MQAARTAGGYVDFRRFEQMRETAHKDQATAIDQVAQEFEALFVDLMLKSAREAEMQGGLFDSNEMDTYREMLDQQIARSMSANHELGIGEVMARQFSTLAGRSEPGDTTVDDSGTPVFTPRYAPTVDYAAAMAPSAFMPSAAPQGSTAGPRAGSGRDGFVAALAPHAADAAARLGIAPSAVLAQAALETGWGEHVMRHADGRSSHNYFGIKAGAGWHGDVVKVQTTEYIGGRAVTVNAAFRAYDDPASAFNDYVDFIGRNPRYRDAVEHGASPHRYAAEIAAAGYATDPAYARKIIAILDGSLSPADFPPATVSN